MYPNPSLDAILIAWRGIDYPIQSQEKNTAVESLVPNPKPQLLVYSVFEGHNPTVNRKLVAGIIPPPIVNDPPFDGRRLRLPTILETWRPPPPMPTMPKLQYYPPIPDPTIIWLWKRIS